MPGGWLGARATGRLDENVLRIALGVVLVVVGAAFAVQAAGSSASAERPTRCGSRGSAAARVAERGRIEKAPARLILARMARRSESAITRTVGKTVRRSRRNWMPKRSTSTTTTSTVRFCALSSANVRSGVACDTTRSAELLIRRAPLDVSTARTTSTRCGRVRNCSMPGPTNLIRPAFLAVALPDVARQVRR